MKFGSKYGIKNQKMSSTMFTNEYITIKLGGFTNGMHPKDVDEATQRIKREYEPVKMEVNRLTFDGDLLKKTGTDVDEARGTSACFSGALLDLKQFFPNASLIAFKKESAVHKLFGEYEEREENGMTHMGFPTAHFGEVKVVGHSAGVGSQVNFIGEILPSQLNVITAPNDIDWDELGVININTWIAAPQTKFHYVMIGGGGVVDAELKRVEIDNNPRGEFIAFTWRLRMVRKSQKDDSVQVVEEFSSK